MQLVRILHRRSQIDTWHLRQIHRVKVDQATDDPRTVVLEPEINSAVVIWALAGLVVICESPITFVSSLYRSTSEMRIEITGCCCGGMAFSACFCGEATFSAI